MRKIYRKVCSDDGNSVREYASRFSGRNDLLPFLTDWQGRIFIGDEQQDKCYILEPFDGKAYEIPFQQKSFLQKIEDEPLFRNQVFDAPLFDEMHSNLDAPVNAEEFEYFGFTVPGFLNGQYSAENMKHVNFEVYWELTLQLLGR